MIYPLPTRIAANYSYDAVRIEDMRYDADNRQYVAQVFGITCGQSVPLIFKSLGQAGLQHITTCTITDAEIDAELIVNPQTPDRLTAGLACAMMRLQRLVNS